MRSRLEQCKMSLLPRSVPLQPSSQRRVRAAAQPSACVKCCYHWFQGAVAAAVLTLAPSASHAEELTLRFQAAQDPDVRRAQAELVQTFAYVTYYYVNEDFEGVDWQGTAEQTLRQSQQASSAAAVNTLTNDLLGKLNDPYTRKLDKQAAAVFKAEQEGQVLSYGVGLDCAEASTKHACAVSFVAPNSPAERAGILTGDTVQGYNSKGIDGESSRELKGALESRSAPALDLTIQPNTSESSSKQESRRVTLRTAVVDIDPVQYGFVRRDDGKSLGYMRVGAMASTTPASVQKALRAFEAKQTSGIIIDLRDNPGGIVEAGRGVGNHLLSPNDVFVSGAARGEFFDVSIDSDASQTTLTQPKMVLVNNNTASSSEMLASALRARGAVLVGEPTRGKSRAQKVIDLESGSLLLVSMVKYIGASGESFDKGGLQPDIACVPDQVSEERYEGGALTDDVDLRQDPCIDVAAIKIAVQSK